MEKKLLEKCIETYGTDLYTFCRNLTRNEQDADDLYQDTFFTIMDKGKELHLEDNPKSYLLGIAIRLWKNRRRKFAWRQRIMPQCSYEKQQELHMQEFEKSPEDIVLSKESDAKMREAISRLPDKYRLVIYLYYMEELSIEEIAGILKLSRSTIKNRLYTARNKLRDAMSNARGGLK